MLAFYSQLKDKGALKILKSGQDYAERGADPETQMLDPTVLRQAEGRLRNPKPIPKSYPDLNPSPNPGPPCCGRRRAASPSSSTSSLPPLRAATPTAPTCASRSR